MRTQKGSVVPLEAIIGVAVALLVFIPACMGVSKYFKTSEQAEQSFLEFVNSLVSFSTRVELEDIFVLKMDPETAVIGFTRNVPAYIFVGTGVYSSSSAPGVPTTLVSSEKFFSPPAECQNFPCVCLCQKFEPGEISSLEVDAVRISRQELFCRQRACESVSSLKLGRDFVIMREDQQQARRVEVVLTKEGGNVIVTTR